MTTDKDTQALIERSIRFEKARRRGASKGELAKILREGQQESPVRNIDEHAKSEALVDRIDNLIEAYDSDGWEAENEDIEAPRTAAARPNSKRTILLVAASLVVALTLGVWTMIALERYEPDDDPANTLRTSNDDAEGYYEGDEYLIELADVREAHDNSKRYSIPIDYVVIEEDEARACITLEITRDGYVALVTHPENEGCLDAGPGCYTTIKLNWIEAETHKWYEERKFVHSGSQVEFVSKQKFGLDRSQVTESRLYALTEEEGECSR